MTLAQVLERQTDDGQTLYKEHGDNALKGALKRMCPHSNHSRQTDQDMSADFGQWGDWDNGHTDG
jgi:hypothetical protein